MTFKWTKEEGEYVYFTNYQNDEIRMDKQMWIMFLGAKEEMASNLPIQDKNSL